MGKPLFASTCLTYFERERRRTWGVENLDQLEARWNRICDAMELNAALHPNWSSEKRVWRRGVARSVRRFVQQECSWTRLAIQTLQA